MDLPELEAAIAAIGHPPYHARQVYSWIYRKGVTDFEQMTNLSRPLRADLAERFRISTPGVVDKEISEDGTVKFLLELEDGLKSMNGTPRRLATRDFTIWPLSSNEHGLGTKMEEIYKQTQEKQLKNKWNQPK